MGNIKTGEFIIYNSGKDTIKVEVYFYNETIWLTQKKIAELFDTTPQNITLHLSNIFEEGELVEERTCKEFLQVQIEGEREVKRTSKFYNLDAIISVGYRINSAKATQFRIWATKVLKEYLIKGFTIDDDKLKNGQFFQKDYFRELLERIRSIRASERRIYQQITDIFAECSCDYDKNSVAANDFFATIQNKFHYAITACTAAEIVYNNANSKRENMG